MKIIDGFNLVKIALARRSLSDASSVRERETLVRQIIDDVQKRGDAALFEYTERFDGVKLASLEIDKNQIAKALDTIDSELRSALELSAENIAVFHDEQKLKLVHDSSKEKLGWLMRPLNRVGLHVPGFSAPLPSSLLMTAVPARVAGVREIILATPPGKQGVVSPITLAAAKIAGVNRVFSIGGAQAIAAFAFGTKSVPRVDKVCGPGNIYVSTAKKMVFGDVGIDGLYGPTEVFIIADDTARADYCAADLLAQAEHGSGASAILVTTSGKLAAEVNSEVERQLQSLNRNNIVNESLERSGLIAVVATVDEAIELANLYAPEHLCLVIKNASTYIGKVRNAGCLFVGENSIEALVDYIAGPSHVLPTEGTARFSSPLNILDFVKLMTLVHTNKTDIKKLGRAAAVIARAEGLDAHARALEKRLEEMGKGGR